MVLGGIILPNEALAPFSKAMEMWRQSNGMLAELKWTKVSGQKFAEYKSLIDFFFSVAGVMRFRSVVFDTTEIDYATYHKGDKELGFYKFFYQFLLHEFGKYATSDEHRLLVHFDQRVSKIKFSTLYTILNRGICKKYGRNANVVRHIDAVDSKKCDVIQMADVLMGAVGYHWNDCHLRPGARQAKVALADYIAKKANLLSLKEKTPWSMKHFGIWSFKFAGRKKKAP